MRRLLAVAIVLLAGTVMLNAQEGRKKRVAIFDFEYGTVRSAVAGIFGSDVDVGKGISDLLVKHLVRDGSYSVIERKALDKILAEQNFSNSDRANPSSAAQIGKLLGVDAIIIGSITQFGQETKGTGIGGVGGGMGRIGLGGFKRSNTKAIVTVDARIVDIDTGEILAVADGKGESKRSSTSMLGGGGSWRGFGAGGVDFSSSNFEETILGEAVKGAVEEMSTGIVASKDRLVARTVKVEGLVAFVEAGQGVLNVGTSAGLKVGDQLDIERVTREIKDPSTGQVIRRMTSKVGTVKVVEADEGSAVVQVLTGADIQVGDMAKTTTQ